MGELAKVARGDEMPERVIGKVTVSDIVRYAGAGGDFNPIHHDLEFAKLAGQENVFTMGMWQGGVLATAAADWLGPQNVRRYKCRFKERVWPGDKMICKGKVREVREEGGERLADLDLLVERGNGAVAVEGEATFVVA